MARNPSRESFPARTVRDEKLLRSVRTRRPVFDLPYVFADADFVGQTISGTYYGWAKTEATARPLRLQRYGGLISLTGTFKRLWTTDGTTPGGYTAQPAAIIDLSSSIPADPDAPSTLRDVLMSVATNGFRVPIHHDNNASQQDLATVYTADLELASSDFLTIADEHVNYALTGGAPQVPKRRTVYFYVNITVPYTPPPS